MNQYISQLFDRIDLCHEAIKATSEAIEPKVPEPWASMTAEEIIKGLGVYKWNVTT